MEDIGGRDPCLPGGSYLVRKTDKLDIVANTAKKQLGKEQKRTMGDIQLEGVTLVTLTWGSLCTAAPHTLESSKGVCKSETATVCTSQEGGLGL